MAGHVTGVSTADGLLVAGAFSAGPVRQSGFSLRGGRGARARRTCLALLASFLALPLDAGAEQLKIRGTSPDVVVQPAPQQQVLAIPSPEELLALIRTTVIALNQANMTGNYTVLRDIGAPPFRSANDASKLSLIFKGLRDQNVDLSLTAQVTPELSDAPVIDRRGLLQLVGRFPTQPLSVDFRLAFARFEGRWQPYAITVSLAVNEPRVSVAPQQLPKVASPAAAPARAVMRQ